MTAQPEDRDARGSLSPQLQGEEEAEKKTETEAGEDACCPPSSHPQFPSQQLGELGEEKEGLGSG